MPDVRTELKEAVREHKKAAAVEAKARKKLTTKILKARKSGEVSMTEVAAIWGVSRQSLYKLLRENGGV